MDGSNVRYLDVMKYDLNRKAKIRKAEIDLLEPPYISNFETSNL